MNFAEISHNRLQPVVAYVWDTLNGNFRPATADDFAGTGGGGGGSGISNAQLVACSGVLNTKIVALSGFTTGQLANYALLAGDNTFTGNNQYTQTLRLKAGGFNDSSVEFGSSHIGFSKYTAGSVDYILVQTANNSALSLGAIGNGFGGFGMQSAQLLSWSAGGDPTTVNADTALARHAAGIVEVNNGTAGTLGTIMAKDAIGLPFVKTVTGVNLKVAAATSFFTVPVGRKFICTCYIIAPTTVNTVTAPGAFGPFAGASNQLAADTSTAGVVNNSFTTVDSIVQQVNFSDPLTGGQWGVAVAGDDINWNVIIGATATTLIADISIMGYYI